MGDKKLQAVYLYDNILIDVLVPSENPSENLSASLSKKINTASAATVKSLFATTTNEHLYFTTPMTYSYFTLTPSQEENWVTTITSSDGAVLTESECGVLKQQALSAAQASQVKTQQKNFNIVFLGEYSANDNSKNRFQCATLVVKLNNSDKTKFWQFHGDGVFYNGNPNDFNCRIQTELLDNNTTLLVKIDQVQAENNNFNDNYVYTIPFRYKASCLDLSDDVMALGQVNQNIYISQDPSIGVGRGTGN